MKRIQVLGAVLLTCGTLIGYAESWIGVPVGTVNVPESLFPKMLTIPEATFRMGTDTPTPKNRAELDASPASTVRLSAFKMAETLPTLKLWRLFLQDTGYTGYAEEFQDFEIVRLKDIVEGEMSPLIGISWYEAIVFCNWLSIKRGLHPAYEITGTLNPKTRGGIQAIWNRGVDGYRLATEAEWEYVMFEGQSREEVVRRYKKWFDRPQPKKLPDVWTGWYQTSFGVLAYPNSKMREWVWDEYEPFNGQPKINPVGKSGLSSRGATRVNRFFRDDTIYFRFDNKPETIYIYSSIRLAQDIPVSTD